MTLHSSVQKGLHDDYYFSKSPPIRLNKGIIHFLCFDTENETTLAYANLFLRYPSLFDLDIYREIFSIDIRQMPIEYEFYYRKLYKRGDRKFVKRLVYCINPSIRSWRTIGFIDDEAEDRQRINRQRASRFRSRPDIQEYDYRHEIDIFNANSPEDINFISQILSNSLHSSEYNLEHELGQIRESIDELRRDTNELFKYNELVRKEFKKIESVIQSLGKNGNKQLQTRIKNLQDKKIFRLPFSKK